MTRISKYRKVFFLILFSFAALGCFAQTTYSVEGTVNGCKSRKIFLSRIHGKQVLKTDSAFIRSDCSFTFSMPSYTGVLRVSLNDSNYRDLIFNNENIKIAFCSSRLNDEAQVIQSAENEVYLPYLKQIKAIDDSAEVLITMGQKLYDADPSGNATALKKIMKQIDDLRKEKNNSCFKISAQHSTMYVSQLVKADIIPDFSEYKKKKDAAPYPNEAAFLKEHYFDYVDFSDSTLINSDVFFRKCGDYFGYFADPPSTEAYNNCIDFILVRAEVNKSVYDYIISTLISTYEHTDWEDVYLHIVEKYNKTNTCTNDELAKEMNSKSDIIKMLKKGNSAPDIVISDPDGNRQVLDSVSSKYVLVMFWASWCEYCEKAIPDLKKIYEAYHSKGFEIFAVSCDSINERWQYASKVYALPWINTCDLKGYKSDAIINYNIWLTPTFYLLDSNKKIISKPYNTAKLSEELEELIW